MTRLLFALLALGTIAHPADAQRRDSNRDSDRDSDRYSCDTWGRRARQRFCDQREMGMRPVRGPLRIDGGANGGVSVVGWDRDSIHVIAHLQAEAGSREEAQAMVGQIRVTTAAGEIRADGPSSRSRTNHWAVSYEVWVPRNADLSLSSTNGPVEVAGVTGIMRLETENGPITLDGVGGDVQARATNGPLSINLGGTKWEGTGLDAETVNGPVHLEIPATYSARLETGTVNGPFDLDTPLTVTFQGKRYSRITSILGAGGATVRAVTTNGPVAIRRD